jgi:hypothetical protein
MPQNKEMHLMAIAHYENIIIVSPSSAESIIDKAQRTNRLSFDEDGDDFAVVIGTFGGLFGGILTYAGLNLIFGPQKEK